jgi:hypothetical protein
VRSRTWQRAWLGAIVGVSRIRRRRRSVAGCAGRPLVSVRRQWEGAQAGVTVWQRAAVVSAQPSPFRPWNAAAAIATDVAHASIVMPVSRELASVTATGLACFPAAAVTGCH